MPECAGRGPDRRFVLHLAMPEAVDAALVTQGYKVRRGRQERPRAIRAIEECQLAESRAHKLRDGEYELLIPHEGDADLYETLSSLDRRYRPAGRPFRLPHRRVGPGS